MGFSVLYAGYTRVPLQKDLPGFRALGFGIQVTLRDARVRFSKGSDVGASLRIFGSSAAFFIRYRALGV